MAESVCFPKKLFENHFGFGIDSGGSCFKIAYAIEEGDKLRFNFALYPKHEYREAFEFIKKTCGEHINPGSEVITCGVSMSEHNEAMFEILGIRSKTVYEMTKLVDAFQFLCKHLPWTEVVRNPSQEAMDGGLNKAKNMVSTLAHLAHEEPRLLMSDPKLEDIPEVGVMPPGGITYPFILNVCGSVPVPMLVNEDGTFWCKTFNPLGGRSFLGLGGYIAKMQGFDQLHAKMCGGDITKVDQTFGSLTESEISGYEGFSALAKMRAFAFGHLVKPNTDDVRTEDVLASLMEAIIQVTVKEACNLAAQLGTSQVVYCGSLPSASQTVRDMFTDDHMFDIYGQGRGHLCDHYFVRHGSFLGAMGTLLANLKVVKDEAGHT